MNRRITAVFWAAAFLPALASAAGAEQSSESLPPWGPYLQTQLGVSWLEAPEQGKFAHFALIFGVSEGGKRSHNLNEAGWGSAFSASPSVCDAFITASCAPDFRFWRTVGPGPVEATCVRVRPDAVAVMARFTNSAPASKKFYAALVGGTYGTMAQAVKPLDDCEGGVRWGEWGGCKLKIEKRTETDNCLFVEFPTGRRDGSWRCFVRDLYAGPNVDSAEALEFDVCTPDGPHEIAATLVTPDGPFNAVFTADSDDWVHMSLPLAEFKADLTIDQSDWKREVLGRDVFARDGGRLLERSKFTSINHIRFRLLSEKAAIVAFDNIKFNTQMPPRLLAAGSVVAGKNAAMLKHPAMKGVLAAAPLKLAGTRPAGAFDDARARAAVLQAADFAPVIKDEGRTEELLSAGKLELDNGGLWAVVQQDQIEVPAGESRYVCFLVVKGKADDGSDVAQLLDEPVNGEVFSGLNELNVWPGPDDEWGRAMKGTAGQAMMNLYFSPAWGELEPIPGRMYFHYYFWDSAFHAIGMICFEQGWARRVLDRVFKSPWLNFSPIHTMAWWTLYQRTGDKSLLEKYYDRAVDIHGYWRQIDLDGDGLPSYGAGLPACSGWLQTHNGMDYYPICDAAQKDVIESPDDAAYVIRQAKLIRLAAHELGRPQEEIAALTKEIERAEESLNRLMWDEERAWYAAIWSKNKQRTDVIDVVVGAFPLFSNSVPPERLQRLCKVLSDPARYWSNFGLRSVDKAGPYYNAGGYWRGPVWPPYNWKLWRGLLGEGEIELAQQLACNHVGAWCAYHAASGGKCPEYINGDNGTGIGTQDYSGLSAAVLDMYAAYAIPGTVTAGFDTVVREIRFEPQVDTLSFKAETPFRSGPTGFVAVMGKPGGVYTDGAEELRADSRGAVTFARELSPGCEMTVKITPLAK